MLSGIAVENIGVKKMEVEDKFSLGTCADCDEEAKYSIYQLNNNGTKQWIHVCDEHDKETDRNNRELRNTYPENIWVEKNGGR